MPAKRHLFRQRPSVAKVVAKHIVERMFSEWFDGKVIVEPDVNQREVDLIARVGTTTMVLVHVATADTAAIEGAIHRLKVHVRRGEVPVVVVPFMGEVGRRLCAQAGIGWLDLSGNASLQAPALRVHVQGLRNRYVHLGRPATPFAPKSSRLARWLLIHPQASFSQRELARHTDLDPSQVSRLIARLREQRLIRVDTSGRVALADRRLMLEAWRADYKFEKHHTMRAHVPGRSGAETAERLTRAFKHLGIEHAFTGLAGAWSYTRYAAYRLVTVFVQPFPAAAQLQEIDLVEQDKGSNVWLVSPNDRGVFDGARTANDLRCAHPVQVWMDLKSQPERAQEAADELYTRLLKGVFDG